MLDHVVVTVSDYERAKRFYSETLRPLGYGAFVHDPDGNNIEAVAHGPP